MISARQVLLHIAPGDAGYGPPMLGLHLYSWALILFLVIALGCALLLMFERQFEAAPADHAPVKAFGVAAFMIAAALVLGNGVSTVLECAGGLCPDNPTDNLLLR